MKTRRKLMTASGVGLALLLVLVWLGCPSAWALTTDQVIALRKAGISNELILKMIESEMAAQARGGIGKYVVKQKDGSEIIVYEASSPRGVVDYPLDGVDPAGVDRMSVALGLERRNYPAVVKKAPPQAAPAKRAKQGRRYTLHLSSFKKEPYAQKELKALKAKGVKVRMQAVDLPGKGRWYRVLTGDFATRTQAKSQGELLQRMGSISSFHIIPR